jgi:hypothetical protein
MKTFGKFLALCLLSIAAYASVFLFVVRKPLTVGVYKQMIELKQERVRSLASPRLLIIAGSNGLFSHSAETLTYECGVPVVNASLTAAFSLPFIIDQTRPLLREGDVVYMPIEYGLYAFDLEEEKCDGHYLIAYDRESFWRQDSKRIVNQMFSFDLPYLISGLGEMALEKANVQRRFNAESLNDRGDQIGHTEEAGKEYRPVIEAWKPLPAVEPETIRTDSFTQRYLADFLEWAGQNGVVVVGGLPTMFDDQPVSDATVNAVREVFESRGHYFVALPNRSQYPREMFFDTPFHLHEQAQHQHSRALAPLLRPFVSHEDERNLPWANRANGLEREHLR